MSKFSVDISFSVKAFFNRKVEIDTSDQEKWTFLREEALVHDDEVYISSRFSEVASSNPQDWAELYAIYEYFALDWSHEEIIDWDVNGRQYEISFYDYSGNAVAKKTIG